MRPLYDNEDDYQEYLAEQREANRAFDTERFNTPRRGETFAPSDYVFTVREPRE